LAAAAKKAKKAGQSYAISQGSKTHSTIYTDWANFKNVSFRDSNGRAPVLFNITYAGFSLCVHG
jgi:hypothetical protein